jgi:hypothetical protein
VNGSNAWNQETKKKRRWPMRFVLKSFMPMVLAAAIAAPVFVTGCSARVRVYDPYYHDYHYWNGEVVYYNQWEHDTHRDHVDYGHRNADDQKAYWDWRHSHEQH